MSKSLVYVDEDIAALAVKLAAMLEEDFKSVWSFETKQILKYMPLVEEILDKE